MLLALLACTTTPDDYGKTTYDDTDERSEDEQDTSDDHGDDTGGGGDGGDGGDGGEAPADAPTLSGCEAWCYLHSVGKESYQWRITCTADDPQGPETIEHGGVEVTQSGSTVTEYLLACDDEGACSTSFDESQGVLCASASTYSFAITVEDFNGNVSAVTTVTGEDRS